MAGSRWEASCQPLVLSQCGATAVIMLVGDTYTLINYVSFINYLCYGVTILGLLVLRWRRPALHRPIKVRLEIARATFIQAEHQRQVWVTMTVTTACAECRTFHALTYTLLVTPGTKSF